MNYFVIIYDRDHSEIVDEYQLAEKIWRWGKTVTVRLATAEEIKDVESSN